MLLELWRKDRAEMQHRRKTKDRRNEPNQKESTQESVNLKLRKDVIRYISVGHVSKAMKIIKSQGVANLCDPNIQALL